MQTADFSILDELFSHLDTPGDPCTVQLEVRATGSIDVEKLTNAIAHALRTHPLARGRRVPWKGVETRYRWEFPDEADVQALTVVDCACAAELQAARVALHSESPPLASSPPLRVTLARCSGGDYLMLNVSHTAADGMGTVRILQSIIRAYAGEDDPVPDFDPLSVRDLGKSHGAGDVKEAIKRLGPLMKYLLQSVLPPSRIARDGASGQNGYGFKLLQLGAAQSQQIMALREGGATVNDVLLAGLHLAIERWNQQHDESARRISVMMPVNLRPKAWWAEVVGNFSVFVAVSTEARERRDFSSTLAAIVERTTWLKKSGATRILIDLLRGSPGLPLWLKRASRSLIPLTGDRVVDTAVLSNLGRVAKPEDFSGAAGEVTELWFSPPARMPLGLAMGAVSMEGQLFLTFRYRHALWDAAAADRFVALLLNTLQ